MRAVRLVLTSAQLIAGVAVAARLARGRTRPAPLDAQVAAPTEAVSVLIPARNEQARLGPCLDALTADPQVGEIIVVDDRSDDATAIVAARPGVRVLSGAEPPAGWVGKPWALQQGLQAARGPWVVTLDADTRPCPGLVAALVDAAQRYRYHLLTVSGRYESGSVAEQALHASMVTSLVYRVDPPGTAPRRHIDRVLANGQCTVFRKDELLADGGFAAAAGYFADDVALARHVARRGRRVGLLDAADLLTVDMHDGVRSVWTEWARTLSLADVTPAAVSAADLTTWALTTAVPVLRVLSGRGRALDAGLLIMRCALSLGLRRSYQSPRWGVALSPLADPAVMLRMTLSVLRPARRWRGRTYPASPGPNLGTATMAARGSDPAGTSRPVHQQR